MKDTLFFLGVLVGIADVISSIIMFANGKDISQCIFLFLVGCGFIKFFNFMLENSYPSKFEVISEYLKSIKESLSSIRDELRRK